MPTWYVKKVIQLSEAVFDDLIAHPYKDRDFIIENRDLVKTQEDSSLCILALGKNRDDGVMIKLDGFSYVRYGALVPHARYIVMKEMEQAADRVIQDGVRSTSEGRWITYYNKLPSLTGMEITKENGLAPLLLEALEARPETAQVLMCDDHFDVFYNLDYCTNLSKDAPSLNGSDGVFLKDLLAMGSIENAYIVHSTIDAGFIYAGPLTTLTEKGRQDHVDLLNAKVTEIRPGAYGPEIVLTDVDAELLIAFDRSAAAHEQAEFIPVHDDSEPLHLVME